ncbi:MAG: extracellular solute-binding protein [Tyzzerella sp.]|nr:extracellular solute-binding protein [Tyzzerella sp.]
MKQRTWKQRVAKVLTVAMLLGTMATALTACGGSGSGDAGDRTVVKFWASVNQYTTASMNELVTKYNEGQGKIDGVFVQADLTKTDVSSNHYSICPENVKNQTDILSVSDRYIFAGASYASGSYYTDLSAMFADESLRTKNEDGEYVLNLEDLSEAAVERFYFNRETGEAGNMETGTLYALPQGSSPTMLIYNEDYFTGANINIVSIKEEELADYNKKNGTSYAPRGYCEYTVDATPDKDLKTSKNLAGEEVVKVFNNLIPMNYIELNTLSKNFTQSYNSEAKSVYGVLNEWWFSHGWPVGGNCVAWDAEAEQHVFTLGETNPNYYVTKDITIDGTEYKAGDVLGYNARKYVAANAGNVDMSALYEIPTQYEQFREFCALSQKTDAKVDGAMNGYGISPDPNSFSNSSKMKYFTSGQVAMLVEAYSNLNTIVKSTKAKINVAPLYTFREFEGEGQEGSNELKVVGKAYDGVTFTGELKKVNDTAIASESVGSSDNLGYAIPANSTKKEAAFKFLQYLCSEEAQAIMAKANGETPTNKNLALSKEYAEQEGRLVDNYAAVGMMSSTCQIGDWSYLGDKEWITDWSVDLNGDVRNGVMSLDDFFAKWNPRVNGTEDYKKNLTQSKYMTIKWKGLQ